MKNIDIDLLEKIFLCFGILFIGFYFIYFISGNIDFVDEKECYNYYLKNGYKLKSCERWFK